MIEAEIDKRVEPCFIHWGAPGGTYSTCGQMEHCMANLERQVRRAVHVCTCRYGYGIVLVIPTRHSKIAANKEKPVQSTTSTFYIHIHIQQDPRMAIQSKYQTTSQVPQRMNSAHLSVCILFQRPGPASQHVSKPPHLALSVPDLDLDSWTSIIWTWTHQPPQPTPAARISIVLLLLLLLLPHCCQSTHTSLV